MRISQSNFQNKPDSESQILLNSFSAFHFSCQLPLPHFQSKFEALSNVMLDLCNSPEPPYFSCVQLADLA